MHFGDFQLYLNNGAAKEIIAFSSFHFSSSIKRYLLNAQIYGCMETDNEK